MNKREVFFREIIKGGIRMNKNKILLLAMGAVFIFTMAILIGNPVRIGAAEKCAIVTIQSHEGISPETLRVKKGDCVVWINWTRGEDVKVIFKEGKRCQDMTKSSMGFRMDWNGCYITDYLDFGRTSSLLFDQAGTFNYEVEFRPTSSPLGAARIGLQRSGTIIVE
jgi:plastocyanin